MTILSQLPKITERKAKRLGRGIGSGKGSKSGRGTTRHQKAREDIPLHFEGGQGRMVKKYPLLRGKGRNKSIHRPAEVVSMTSLNSFADNDIVNFETLIEKGIIHVGSQPQSIKILSNGTLERKLTVRVPVSAGAKKQIESVGGTVDLII